jgi:hypothetical protein
MRIVYTALRNLAAGHTLEESYEIVVFASVIEPEFEFKQNRQTSLDQSRVEVEVLGSYQMLDVSTDFIPVGTDTAEFEEFLHSVMHGESFVLDPDSDIAATVVGPLTVMMTSTRYRRDRSLPGHYAYGFSVRTI